LGIRHKQAAILALLLGYLPDESRQPVPYTFLHQALMRLKIADAVLIELLKKGCNLI
jgi:hypothetical protein